MKKRILSLLLVALMILGAAPLAATWATSADEALVISCKSAAGETIALPQNGAVQLAANADEVRWQIEYAADEWVDIQGAVSPSLRVSYGMVAQLLSGGCVRMRCVDDERVSEPVTIEITQSEPQEAAAEPEEVPEPLPAPVAVQSEPAADEHNEGENVEDESADPLESEEYAVAPLSLGEDDAMPLAEGGDPEPTATPLGMVERVNTYTITVEYVYAEDSSFAGYTVAQSYVGEFAEGGSVNETVTSPNRVGYAPDKNTVELNYPDLREDVKITVKYSPAAVSYTVRHYLQNVDSDEYTQIDTTVVSGKTEALTSNEAAAKDYTGFTALSHYSEKIAADGSTSVDIYYDRKYYMLSFDLDGGYGTEPVYARYGAAISAKTPTRAGYNFAGWVPVLPATMPAESMICTAQWTQSDTTYKISYWLQDADPDAEGNYGYSFVGSITKNATTGETVSGGALSEDEAKELFGEVDWKYYSFNEEKTDKDIPVAGDGSTVVRVYYDRNEYTLRFYYARQSKEKSTDISVSTNTGGSSSNGAEKPDEADWSSASALPTLTSDYVAQKNDKLSGYYDYYYIDLTAKYGANLEKSWPGAPFVADDSGYHAGNYKFVSWGTQYGSGYNTTHDNKNIKGLYSQMDAQLLIDPEQTKDKGVNHWLVGYWSKSPNMYTYKIYYETVTGEEVDIAFGGKNYTYKTEYDVGSTDTTLNGQSQLAFAGVTFAGKESDDTTLTEGSVIRFYYNRIERTVTFYDGYTKENSTNKPVPYGGRLVDYLLDGDGKLPTPNYPESLQEGAYEFEGWYTDDNHENKLTLSENETMPDEDVVYYAHWVPVTRTVKVYKTAAYTDQIGSDISVANNELVPAENIPEEPTSDSGDEFIGWFYADSNGEHAFSFTATPVAQDLKVYAKWRSTQSSMVTVRYLLDGTDTEVAKTETQRLTIGQLRTYSAKTGTSLYADYQTGCFPMVASQSVTPTAEDVETGITVTFTYKQFTSVPYKVYYKIVDEDGTKHPAFYQDGDTIKFNTNRTDVTEYVREYLENNRSIVTEWYLPTEYMNAGNKLPENYLPDALQVQKVIVPGETDGEFNRENTITFYYRYTEEALARYSVNHYIQNSAGDGYTEYQHTEGVGAIDATAQADPISIAGYEFSADVTTRENAEGVALTGETLSGTIAQDHSLQLNFYYTAIEYPYRVMYLEAETDKVLRETKTTSDEGGTLKARYGSTVTEAAPKIENYRVDNDSKSIVIQQEASVDTASLNTIYFYYTPISGGLKISKKVALDPEQAAQENIDELPKEAEEQEFTFTVKAAKGFHKGTYTYTKTDAEKNETTETAVVQNSVLTLTLKSGESLVIHGLQLGDYTVTETYVPGFLAVTGGTTMGVTATVKLAEEDETVTVDYENRYPFYTGDLVLRKQIRKQDESDPNATGVYKVHVTLTPEESAREIARTITWTNADGAPANSVSEYTIPALGGGDGPFEFDVYVPVGTGSAPGEVKLEGVPVGGFTAEEQADQGYITAYYDVKYDYAVHPNDEKINVSGASASGTIHGGHPTAVTFRNTYKKGSLTIEKTVEQEYANDSFAEGTFTFDVTGYSELPAGEYALGDEKTATVGTDGSVTLSFTPSITVTKAEPTGRLTLEKLPAGKYTVTETVPEGYTCNREDNRVSDLMVGSGDATASFINTFTRTTGQLIVSKTIKLTENADSGVKIETERAFEFTLVPLDDADLTSLSGDGFTVRDGNLIFELKHGTSITIRDLPVGQYELRETAVEKYESNFDPAPNDKTYTKRSVEITTDKETIVACENKFPVNTATLVVSKTVTAADGDTANAAPADDSFIFKVMLSDYDENITLPEFVTSSFSGAGSGSALVFGDNDGAITFVLKNGESMTLTLPVCAFTVEEIGMSSCVNTDNDLAEHYDVSYAVENETGVAGKLYYLDTGKTVTAAFTNTYKRHYADLTIKTSASYKDQNFIFDVVSADESVRLQVILDDNDSRTIKDLPLGQYTVTEQNAWSWREETVEAQTTDLTTGSQTVTFDYGTAENRQWLSGYSHSTGKGD